MIRRAKRKAGDLPNATFTEGDVSSLEFPDSSFDLVMDFGIVHHVPNWKNALAEVHRTLKVHGEFLFEDLSVETWERGIGIPVSYTHLTLPTMRLRCRSRGSPDH